MNTYVITVRFKSKGGKGSESQLSRTLDGPSPVMALSQFEDYNALFDHVKIIDIRITPAGRQTIRKHFARQYLLPLPVSKL